MTLLTDNEFGVELHRNRHHNLLEGIQVICVTHMMSGPWNVDRAEALIRY